MLKRLMLSMSLLVAATGVVTMRAVGVAPQSGAPTTAPSGSEMRGTSEPQQLAKSEQDVAEYDVLKRICTACHKFAWVEGGVRTKAEWEDTFNLMKEEGAEGSEQEFEQAFDYVIRHYSVINVNTATAKDLAVWLDETELTAQAVVDHRTANGPFKTIDDLKKVPGVSAQKWEARKDRVWF